VLVVEEIIQTDANFAAILNALYFKIHAILFGGWQNTRSKSLIYLTSVLSLFYYRKSIHQLHIAQRNLLYVIFFSTLFKVVAR